MKLIHLSDLHLGKRVNEFSHDRRSKYILNEILRIIDKEDRMEFFLREIFMTGRFLLRRQCSFLTGFLPGLQSGSSRCMPSAEIMTVRKGSLSVHRS